MKRYLILILVLYSVGSYAQVLRKRTTLLMGGRFDITIVAGDSAAAEMNIDAVISEITRIENLISDWKPASQVSQVNTQAGIRPVPVDREVFELTKRALNTHRRRFRYQLRSHGQDLEIRRFYDRNANSGSHY
jgi:thiamine biosynthesis lipoprotein